MSNWVFFNNINSCKFFHKNWITPGHRSGVNRHNISCTVYIKDNEWKQVAKWLWENRDIYSGIAILPYKNHTYKQAPLEEITQRTYNKMFKNLANVNLTHIIEDEDNTSLKEQLACSAGNCSI